MSALGTAKSIINLVGNSANILTDVTIKDFYSTRDFYNFIRKEQNCPMQHKNFFTVVPEIPVPGISLSENFFKSAWKSITNIAMSNVTASNNFNFNQYNLARFALSIQGITRFNFLE